jgi:hypothetical protein
VLGVARLESGDRSGLGHLPVWLVLVDVGVICTASALIVWGTRAPRPTLVLTHQDPAAPVSSTEPSPTVPFPTIPSPTVPSPGDSLDTATPASSSHNVETATALNRPMGFLATLSSESIARPPPESEEAAPTEPSRESPSDAPTVVPPAAVAPVERGPTPLGCVRCRVALSPGNGWRKCAECGGTLCENCFLVNLREHGRPVCDACAGRMPRR